MSDPTPERFTLRALPLPAKLVVSVFLLAVGLGYSSAMVQLHMQHGERDGNALPTPDNVVAVFAGKKWQSAGGAPVQPGPSKLEAMVSGPAEGNLTAKSMAPAFFREDGADFEKRWDEKPAEREKLTAEREGERRALLAWIKAAPDARRQAYEANRLVLPAELITRPLTPGFRADDAKAVKIGSIIKERCARCHKPGGDKSDVPLTTHEELAKFMPAAAAVPAGGGWVDSGKQISLEKLTQSTHAHLLSFAMLFALTGLTFAFTGFPRVVRCVIGPGVLVAQVTDVSFWWLARLPDVGPYFAYGVLGTGMCVAVGLTLQIVLSLFSMYGRAGRVALVVLFGGAIVAGGLAFKTVIAPYLERERAEKAAAKGNGDPKPEKAAGKNGPGAPSPAGPSKLERVLTWTLAGSDGKPLPASALPRNAKNEIELKWHADDGGMARAFFDKDGLDFKSLMKGATAEGQKKLLDERDGERLAVLAWAKVGAEARKRAYDEDRLALPADLAARSLTADYRAGAAAKVKSILTDRCARCHQPGADKEEIRLDTYEEILKRLQPGPAAGAAPAIPRATD